MLTKFCRIQEKIKEGKYRRDINLRVKSTKLQTNELAVQGTLFEQSNETLSIVNSEDGRLICHHKDSYNKQVSIKVTAIMPNDTLGRKRDAIDIPRNGALRTSCDHDG